MPATSAGMTESAAGTAKRVNSADGSDPPSGTAPVLPLSRQIVVQISPISVRLQDQSYFPSARIGLDVLFSLDRVADVLIALDVNQPLEAMAACKTLDRALAMFEGATGDIARDPDVKDTVGRLVTL